MIFTATTILFFFLIGVGAVALGHFTKRQELYIFGVVVIFFMGLVILDDGVAVQTGVQINETDTQNPNNTTSIDRVDTYVFNQEKDAFTNGLGLLSVLVAAGLALTWWQGRKKEKEQKLRSIELDD